MSKVTITAPTAGNEPVGEISAHAAAAMEAALANPTSLATVVAEAKAFKRDVHDPAEEAFLAAEGRGERDEAQQAATSELEKIWASHGERYAEIVGRILDLPATSREIAATNVQTYAELMTAVYAMGAVGDDPIHLLNDDHTRAVIDYLLNAIGPDDDAAKTPIPDAQLPPSSGAIAALVDQMDRRWTVENAIYKRDHTDDEREKAVAHTGAAAHQLMALPATTLDDFRAKARAIEWALCGDWDTWPYVGTFGDFAKALILELLGDARRRDLTSDASPASEAGTVAIAGPIAEGHAKSDPAPDPATPLGQAIAVREAARRERQAYVDEHDTDAPEEIEDRVSAAEFAVYETPARSVAEIRWKLLEDVMESQAVWSHKEAEDYLKGKGGLDGASQRGILFDLMGLYNLAMPKYARDADFIDQTAVALDMIEASYALSEVAGDKDAAQRKREEAEGLVSRLLEQRPSTIAGVMARARLLDHHAPADCFEDHSKIEWQIARALIGDVKALFCSRPQTNHYGSEDFSALWTAARLAAYTKGDTYPPPPAMSTGKADAELLAAE